MEPLVYHVPRVKLLLRLTVIVVVTALATCLAFWVNPGFPMSGDIDPAVIPYLRVFGAAIMAIGCCSAGLVLEALFWPRPVLRVDEDGVSMLGATVPWDDYRGVAVKSLRVNFVPMQRNLDIKTHARHGLFKRKRLGSNWVPGNPVAIAKQIAAYAEARQSHPAPRETAAIHPMPGRKVVARRVRADKALA
ncbi:MAG: hypothetical protein AAGF78_13735 [Pseudomonadota bacterium]